MKRQQTRIPILCIELQARICTLTSQASYWFLKIAKTMTRQQLELLRTKRQRTAISQSCKTSNRKRIVWTARSIRSSLDMVWSLSAAMTFIKTKSGYLTLSQVDHKVLQAVNQASVTLQSSLRTYHAVARFRIV